MRKKGKEKEERGGEVVGILGFFKVFGYGFINVNNFR